MSDSKTARFTWWRTILDGLATFWPTLVTPAVLALSVHFRHPWLGVAVFVSIALAHRWWWTCIFGLLNAMALLGGILGCAIVGVRIMQAA